MFNSVSMTGFLCFHVQSRTLVRGQANTAEAGKCMATVYMHSQRQETQMTERTFLNRWRSCMEHCRLCVNSLVNCGQYGASGKVGASEEESHDPLAPPAC